MVSALSLLLLACSAHVALSAACADPETCIATVEGNGDESSLLQRVKSHSIVHDDATSAERVNAEHIADDPPIKSHGKEPVYPDKIRNPHMQIVDIEYRFLGCYPRSGEDTEDPPVYMDRTCINWTKAEPCRSGLPFYRLRLQRGQGFNDCFSFCNSKGLDLSGVIQVKKGEGEECRCGATKENTNAWHGNQDPPPNKQLPSTKLPIGDKDCKLLVWQFSGKLKNNSMPYALMQLNVADENYMQSIAVGRFIQNQEDGDVFTQIRIKGDIKLKLKMVMASTEAMAKAQGLCEDAEHTGVMLGNGQEATCSQLTSYCSGTSSTARYIQGVCPFTCGLCSPEGGWVSCYPYKCALGVPWKKGTDETVRIAYYFDSVIDSTRKAVFQKAVEEWELKTCIRFYQSSTKPCIKVTISDTSSCTATIGSPGDNSEGTLNMGWCKTMSDVGSIIHELGHNLGMSHEQNRPDGSQSLQVPGQTVGPYLTMYWQNIQGSWTSQYLPMEESYIGSDYQGAGDPYHGYAPYDYESIMHYGRGSPAAFDTVDSTYNSIVGQRTALSDGDVLQISDMYQCSIPGSSSTTRTPATTTASSATTTGSSTCQDVDPVQWSCGDEQCTCEWLQAANYCDEEAVQQTCPVSCGMCGTSTTTTSSECKDGIPNFQCGAVRCTCEELKASGYCTNADVGEQIRESCPLSCGVCTTTSSTAPVTTVAPTTRPTTIRPTTPPTTMTTSSAACQDGIPNFSCGSRRCTCEEVKAMGYCENPDVGESIRASCPVSCGVCTTTTSTQAPVTTTASTTAPPTTTLSTTEPSPPCQDTEGPAGWTCNGFQCTCPQVQCSCSQVDQVKTACPLTCGICQATPSTIPLTTGSPTAPPSTMSTSTAACEDTAGPPGWGCSGRPCTCPEVSQYCTSDNEFYRETVLTYCPATCGVCGGTTSGTTTDAWWQRRRRTR